MELAISMGKKKKSDEASTKEAPKTGKKKLSVSALLARMESNPDKPNKTCTSNKAKPKAAPKV